MNITLTILTILILGSSCQKPDASGSKTNQESGNKPLTVSIPEIGELSIKNPQLDSTNTYGAGDCAGTTSQFGNYGKALTFDTLDCGEYALTNTIYYLENGLVKIVFIQRSETNLTLDLSDRTYSLAESVYDFRKPPFKMAERTGTYLKPDFELLNIAFEQVTLEDPKTTLEHLENLYLGIWEMEEDY